MTDVPEILAELAAYLATVPGIASAHYPAPNVLDADDCPAIVLYWGGPEPTRLEASNASGGTMWLPTVLARIYTPRAGDTPQEFARVDSLVTPVIDALNVPVKAMNLSLTGHVDRITATSVSPTLEIGYAGSTYYGAEIVISMKFHRKIGRAHV